MHRNLRKEEKGLRRREGRTKRGNGKLEQKKLSFFFVLRVSHACKIGDNDLAANDEKEETDREREIRKKRFTKHKTEGTSRRIWRKINKPKQKSDVRGSVTTKANKAKVEVFQLFVLSFSLLIVIDTIAPHSQKKDKRKTKITFYKKKKKKTKPYTQRWISIKIANWVWFIVSFAILCNWENLIVIFELLCLIVW
jgi:hypothetical protein